MSIDVRPLVAADAGAYGAILGQAFSIPPKDVPRFIERVGPDRFLVADVGGRVVGGCCAYRVGHYVGGRAVAAAGIAAVAVAVDQRGKGVASALMRHALQRAHAEGLPLSSLYPAAVGVYRRAGFEHAAEHMICSAPLRGLPRFDTGMAARPMQEEDLPAMQALYAEIAREEAMLLDRPEVMWARILEPFDTEARAFVVEDASGVAGWLVFSQGKVRGDLEVRDLFARTQPGLRRLWSLLAANGSVFRNVRWVTSPADPSLLVLEEPEPTMQERTQPMLRIVDVQAALTARGYPAGLDCALDLHVVDPLLPYNDGRWRLEVAGGVAQVERGGSGAVQMPVSSLAPLYSGHRSPQQLARLDRLSGPEASLDIARTIFAGPTPWIAEAY